MKERKPAFAMNIAPASYARVLIRLRGARHSDIELDLLHHDGEVARIELAGLVKRVVVGDQKMAASWQKQADGSIATVWKKQDEVRTSAIEGTVTVAGKPWKGALVHLSGSARPRSMRTDADGNYAFRNLRAGHYAVSATTKTGSYLAGGHVHVPVNEDETQRINLSTDKEAL